MLIWLQITDGSGDDYPDSTLALGNAVHNMIATSTCTDPFNLYFRKSAKDGPIGFDLNVDLDGNNKERSVLIKNIMKMIRISLLTSISESKKYNLYFRKRDLPLKQQNDIVRDIATKAHNKLVGNPDYVNSALFVNFSEENDVDADMNENPSVTIALGLNDCENMTKLSKVIRSIFKIILNETVSLSHHKGGFR